MKLLEVPGGKELCRWPCPIDESKGGRYHSHYRISPDHAVFAISQPGQMTFFNFVDGSMISKVEGANRYGYVMGEFISENTAIVREGHSLNGNLSFVRVKTGQEIAMIPDRESSRSLAVSPSGKYITVRRDYAPIATNAFTTLPRPLVVIWKKIGDYAN